MIRCLFSSVQQLSSKEELFDYFYGVHFSMSDISGCCLEDTVWYDERLSIFLWPLNLVGNVYQMYVLIQQVRDRCFPGTMIWYFGLTFGRCTKNLSSVVHDTAHKILTHRTIVKPNITLLNLWYWDHSWEKKGESFSLDSFGRCLINFFNKVFTGHFGPSIAKAFGLNARWWE